MKKFLIPKQNSHPYAGFLNGCQAINTRKYANPLTLRLLMSYIYIYGAPWIFVCCECRVLLGRGLCDELITRPEESYRLCCVVVCDLETSRKVLHIYIYIYMTLVA